LHRDIKPANIRVTPEGKVMLVDFGLVKMYDPNLKTTMGARALTPGYAPPEQYGRGRTDVRSDLYALGATLYKLLSGQDPAESVTRITGRSIIPIHQINPAVSPALNQVVEKAMALEPDQRFQTATQFKNALLAAVNGTSEPRQVVARAAAPALSPAAQAQAPARPASRPRPSQPRPASRPRPAQPVPQARSASRWWLGGAAILVLLLCLCLGGILIAGIGGGSDQTATQTAVADLGRATHTPQGVLTPESQVSPAVEVRPSATPDERFRSKDPTTYVHIVDGEPETLDPALDYETSGQQVIQNVYEPLIFPARDSLGGFIPQLALEVPGLENGGISSDGREYTFHIRPGVRFHDGSPLTAEDVAFTFQRGILQGGLASPQWLLTEPLLGIGSYDITYLVDPGLADDAAGLAKADPGKLLAACQRVVDAVRADTGAGTVTFRLAQPWAPFLPTLASGWAGIGSKAWISANGGWDGDCSTWQNYYGKTAADLNQLVLGSSAMGTGPYRLESWTVGDQIVLKANQDYWRKEAAWEGGPSGVPAIQTVIIQYKPEAKERLALIQSGDADSVDLQTVAERLELERVVGQVCNLNDDNCTPTDHPDAPLEKIHGYPLASRSPDLFFNWQINTQDGNPFMGSGKLDGQGIPPDFFSNLHVRKAFAYCFDYKAFLDQALSGEGIRAITVMLPNMIGYDANTPYYNHDLKLCEQEFRQAEFDGQRVWEVGFRMKLPYNQRDLEREKAAQIWQSSLAEVNDRFQLEPAGLESGEYYDHLFARKAPIFFSGWVEDIHDPHNWVYPYILGTYGGRQNLPEEVRAQFAAIINQAVEETDPARRGQVYQQFNQLYYDLAPSIPLFQEIGQSYRQRWIQGWYYNPAFPGLYFYALSKY
jgi:peptide/nickel transport system substrate-binding protein